MLDFLIFHVDPFSHSYDSKIQRVLNLILFSPNSDFFRRFCPFSFGWIVIFFQTFPYDLYHWCSFFLWEQSLMFLSIQLHGTEQTAKNRAILAIWHAVRLARFFLLRVCAGHSQIAPRPGRTPHWPTARSNDRTGQIRRHVFVPSTPTLSPPAARFPQPEVAKHHTPTRTNQPERKGKLGIGAVVVLGRLNDDDASPPRLLLLLRRTRRRRRRLAPTGRGGGRPPRRRVPPRGRRERPRAGHARRDPPRAGRGGGRGALRRRGVQQEPGPLSAPSPRVQFRWIFFYLVLINRRTASAYADIGLLVSLQTG